MNLPYTEDFKNEAKIAFDIEAKVLYILFKHSEKQNFIIENTEKEFFKDVLNKTIFEEAKRLYKNGETIDIGLIADNLQSHKVNMQMYYIVEYAFANSSLIGYYCKRLFEKHMEDLIQAAKTEKDFEFIQNLKDKYTFEEKTDFHISDSAENFKLEFEKRKQSMLFTYYPSLDEIIGAFCGGDYIAFGAGTGVGKTAFALNLARQICIQDKKVLLFSLEMPKMQIQNRFICMNEGLELNKCRTFDFNLIETQKYEQGIKNLKQWNLSVVDDFNLTLEKMRSYMDIQSKKGLDFVILDYLGLIGGLNDKNCYEKTTMISRKLKLLACEFNVPILVLVQLNRDLKNRQNKRPLLSDIRESGAIEQDADFVIFAHREGLYDVSIPPGELELRVAKNRHGASNKTIKLFYDLKTQNITEYDK